MSHERCAELLFEQANSNASPMHGLPGGMAVSDQYPDSATPEFPPLGATCPHGYRFWTYPNADRVAALRALNAASASSEDGARDE